MIDVKFHFTNGETAVYELSVNSLDNIRSFLRHTDGLYIFKDRWIPRSGVSYVSFPKEI